MMTGDDEATSMKAIAIVRDLQRKLANQCFERGISPEDIALGCLHGAFDVAEGAKGPGMTALEWMRTGLDLIERQLLAREIVQ
ncbi:hypothetical protein N0B51_00050 [Tsuneonella sp. YG55]|uniref:Uncharacterized protein n=1 Tax=Tsuneonella litorea TaxID=2976475 RepID=A0A9X2VXX4_9SPHN|nr:hypothetical protein [Tsuneonella litorea]MCT2557367.1 hypothetical protein [Tsuneonella litorea]